MFSLGLGLSLNDFTRIFIKPKEFLIGFLSQLIILPIVALILVALWPLPPEIAIGVMILAAAPGGATSNIGSYYRDNRNYSFDLKNNRNTTSLLSPYIRYRLLSEEDIGGIIVDGGNFDWTKFPDRHPLFNKPDPSYWGWVLGKVVPEVLGANITYAVRARFVLLRDLGSSLSPTLSVAANLY